MLWRPKGASSEAAAGDMDEWDEWREWSEWQAEAEPRFDMPRSSSVDTAFSCGRLRREISRCFTRNRLASDMPVVGHYDG